MRSYFLIFAICLSISACSPQSSNGIIVNGTVTLDGVPLKQGQVVLDIPDQATQRIGGIDGEGKFQIRDVPKGKARAAVRTSHLQAQETAMKKYAAKFGSKGEKNTLVKVPTKYENPETANLSVEIEDGKPLELRLTK